MTDINEDHNHADTELSDKAHALVLHGDNDTHLYHTSKVPVMKNLEKKMKKGVYDHSKAKQAWGYHADKAAQSWTKEHGRVGTKWHEHFSTKDRRAAASHWADEHRAETTLGNFHESTDLAAEIVYSVMEKKPVDVNVNFKEAILERSKSIVDDMKIDMSGKFMNAFGDTNEKA